MHDTIASGLLEGNCTQNDLQAYFQWTIARGEHSRTCAMLEKQVRQDPRHISTLSLYIAACLDAGRNREGLAAIQCLLAYAIPEDNLLEAALAVLRRIPPAPPLAENRPLLSVCMIARNEAGHLGRCLHGVRDLADEIVLVDTGSTDRTRDIALVFGARRYDLPWCDDFSKARNFSLQKATGQWILVLDADEVIAAEDATVIKSLATSPDAVHSAFALTTRNYCHTVNNLEWHANDGRYRDLEAGVGWFPSTKVRLFKNDPGIRFHFPVHERVEPSLEKNGYSVKPCPVPVHHYGHLNETRNRGKALHYFKLGYAKLEKLGDDPGAIRELAVQAGQLEQWQQAVALWHRLLQIRPGYAEAMVNLAGAYWNCEDYAQSLHWARKAVDVDATVREGRFNEAVSLLMLGRFDEARGVLENLVKAYPDYLAAGFMLAAAYACLQLRDKACKLQTALKQSPVGRALPLALEDLAKRMKNAGQGQAAHHLITLLM